LKKSRKVEPSSLLVSFQPSLEVPVELAFWVVVAAFVVVFSAAVVVAA